MKKVLITGTSRGLGKAMAEAFVERNYEVIATARNINDIQIAGVHQKIPLDVSRAEMIESAISKAGEVDILMNNAGISLMGPAEVVQPEEAKRIFDVNFFGAVNMMRAVIPGMRRKGSGLIVNISSCASQFATLYGSYYSATKSALELVSEELRFELQHFGIDVMVMQCGAIDTDIAMFSQKARHTAYTDLNQQMAKRFEVYKAMKNRPPAKSIASKIIDCIEEEPRAFKNTIGEDAAYMLELRQNMSDAEWEENSPFTQDLSW